MCLLRLTCKRKQRHIPCPFDRSFYFPLTTGTIAASFTGKYLAAICQKLTERRYILIVNILRFVPAKTALALLTNSSIASFFSFLVWFILVHSHFNTQPQLISFIIIPSITVYSHFIQPTVLVL
jgi:hypothetical protein